jgi:hypothetical protein
VGRVRPVPGTYYTVNPMAVRDRSVNVFTENKRVVLTIRSSEFHRVRWPPCAARPNGPEETVTDIHTVETVTHIHTVETVSDVYTVEADTCTRTHTHTQTHTYAHTHMHTHSHTHAQHTRTQTQTPTHTHMHTHAHTHAQHTRTQTQTCMHRPRVLTCACRVVCPRLRWW